MRPTEVRHDPAFMKAHWESEATVYVLERKFSAVDAKVLELLDLKAGDRLLEIGFGSCITAPQIVKKFSGIHYIGLDIAEKFIQVGQARLKGAASLVQGSALHLPFQEDSFSSLLEMDSIHHFPREIIPAVVTELARVMRRGGQVLIVEDWAADPQNEQEKLADSLQRRRFLTSRGWEYHPSEAQWTQMLENAGLHLIELSHVRRPLNFGRFRELDDPLAAEELRRLQVLWGEEQPTTRMSLFNCRRV